MTKMTRVQKALAENILLGVRKVVAKATDHDRYLIRHAWDSVFDSIVASLKLEPTKDNPRFSIINRITEEIVDAIRIARTYQNMTAEQIIVSLDIVRDILKGVQNEKSTD